MEIISFRERKRKYIRRKKWKAREAERAANKPAEGADLIYFRNMVTCRLCGDEIHLEDLGQRGECLGGIKTLTEEEKAWWMWYCKSGWERIEIRCEEKEKFPPRLKAINYLCRSCKEKWRDDIYEYIWMLDGGNLWELL